MTPSDTALSRNWLFRRLPFWSIFVLGLILTLWMFRVSILQVTAEFLVIDDIPEGSRFAVLLAGGNNLRPRRAAELFHQGVVESILVCQVQVNEFENETIVPNVTTQQIEALEGHGVPRTAIVVLPGKLGVTSTYDEAVAVKSYIEEQQYGDPLVVVTNAFHSRRARWIFRRVLRAHGVVGATTAGYDGFDETDWWKHENGLVTVNNEYIKLAFYLVRYWNAGDQER